MGLINKLRTSFVLAFISALSFAGHYEAGVSSGLTATASPGTVNGPTYGNGTASASAAFGNATGSASVNGTISTTFTWVSDPDVKEPAPASAIVVQTCNASASARSSVGGSPTASASNGLPAAFCVNTSNIGFLITTGIPYPPYTIVIGLGSDASSSGSAAKIVTGATSIQVTCTVSAAAASSVNVYGCSVDYSVQVFPITVQMNGTVVRKGQNWTLPGKKLQAFLNTGGAQVTKVAGTSNWTIPGSIFDSFYISPSQDVGHQVPVPASTFTASAPQWCFDDAATSNIVGTASFTYNGISIGTGTGKTKVICIKPLSDLRLVAYGIGYVNPTGIYSGDLPLLPAIKMYYRVIVQGFLRTSGASDSKSICQLVSNNRVVDGESVLSSYNSLDNSFPYYSTIGWIPCNLSVPQTDDVLIDNPSRGLSSDNSSVTIQDAYTDFLMFKPPGINDQPVSLRNHLGISWVWAAEASKNKSNPWIQAFNFISPAISSDENSNQPLWNTITIND
jgi:hypothetical protein